MSRHYLSPKETHIKTISPKYTYNIIVGFKCYWIHWGRQLEPKYQSAQHLNSWKQLIRGLHEVWTEADKEWAAYLLLVEPTPCPILLKGEEWQHAIFSNVTRVTGTPFSNYSNISSSLQLSTTPEIMSFGTIHTADLCITAQRLWETLKAYGK